MQKSLVKCDQLASSTLLDSVYNILIFLLLHLRVIWDVWETHCCGIACRESYAKLLESELLRTQIAYANKIKTTVNMSLECCGVEVRRAGHPVVEWYPACKSATSASTFQLSLDDNTNHNQQSSARPVYGHAKCVLRMARGSKPAPIPKKAKLPSKEKPRRTAEVEKKGATAISVPLDIQQKSLDLFRDALNASEAASEALQEVKKHLFNRDFVQAFGKESYLRAYAGRWSPSRALAYHQVLVDVQDDILATFGQDHAGESCFQAICIGGGAGAELVSLATWLNQSLVANGVRKVHATLLDIAAWEPVVAELHHAITTPPTLSAYASAAVKEANAAMLAKEAYSVAFKQMDALSIPDAQCKDMFGNANLITMMFTLNELYSTSVAKTQQMLARITVSAQPGAHLLVVDSPGSYSTVSINGADKIYPMQWLLDLTLVGASKRPDGHDARAKWQKLVTDESRWFRLPLGLKYAIELENCRYQIHLYRKLDE